MNEKNNNFDDITVKSLLEEDEDFYVEKYIDCLDIDTITLTILSQPSKYDYVLNRVAKYCDNDAYVVPVVNGRTIEYISNDENKPLSHVIIKKLFDPNESKTYRLKVTMTLRVQALLNNQKKNASCDRVVIDSNGIYNTGKVIYSAVKIIFSDADNNIDNVIESCTINDIKLRGSISLEHLPEQDGEKYMKLLGCARHYRYTNDYGYKENSKSLIIVGRQFKLKFRDGNNILSKINNKSTRELDDMKTQLSYCKNKIQVTFNVIKEFFEVRRVNDKINKTNTGKYTKKFNIDLFADSIRIVYDAFIKLMIFMYTENDFYNATNARKFIRNSPFQCDTKDILRAYIKRCANDTEFTENSKIFKQFFKVTYSNAYSNNQKKFDKMGLSTIIIPDILGVEHYKNPLVYMYLSKHSNEFDK